MHFKLQVWQWKMLPHKISAHNVLLLLIKITKEVQKEPTFFRGFCCIDIWNRMQNCHKITPELTKVPIYTYWKIDTEKTIYLKPYKSRLFFLWLMSMGFQMTKLNMT